MCHLNWIRPTKQTTRKAAKIKHENTLKSDVWKTHNIITLTLAWIGIFSSHFFHDSGNCSCEFTEKKSPPPLLNTSAHFWSENWSKWMKFNLEIRSFKCHRTTSLLSHLSMWSTLALAVAVVIITFTLSFNLVGNQLKSSNSSASSSESIRITTWNWLWSTHSFRVAAYASSVCVQRGKMSN